MSGEEKPQIGSQNSLPLSQDTFSFLWDHLSNTTQNGSLTQALQSPINWNFNDYNGGDTVEENHIQLEMNRCELTPNDMASDNDDILSTTNSTAFSAPRLDHPRLDVTEACERWKPVVTHVAQQSTFNTVLSPDSAMPSSVQSDYATDVVTPPPPAFTPPPSSGAASQSLPSNVNYAGDYEFQIYLGQPTPTAAKSVSWTYSNTLKKLFVDKDKPCPIQFKTTKAPPPNSYIRAMPIFKKPEHIQTVVKRCPNHASCVQSETGLADPTAYHLIMSSDPSSQYVEDSSTSRLSVLVPYSVPQVGTEYSQYLYTFKCFLSCVGGLNRRQIQVVFTLENGGQILGRQVIDVRVCACPGRDRKGEEKQQSEKQSKKPSKRGSKVTSQFEVTTIGGKKRKTEDDQIYTIFVKGKEKYDLLMKIKESLDLMEYLTPSQVQAYKANQKIDTPQLVSRLSTIQQHDQQLPHQYNQYSPHHVAQQQQQQQHQQQIHLQGMQQSTSHIPPPPPPNSAPPPLNHLPSMPSFPTFQIPQHSHNGDISGGHDMFLQQVGHGSQQQQQQHLHPRPPDMSDGASPPMDVDSVQASQGFSHIISSEEISSSQLQNANSISPVRSPQNYPASQNPSCSQLNQSYDRSISSWLNRLGVGQYADAFQTRGIGNTDQLDEIQLEDFHDMPIPPDARQTIWKAILDLRNPMTSTPSLLKNSSNASTLSVRSQCSYAGQPAPVYHATRFTLKQTLSFKVKEENGEEERQNNNDMDM